MQIVINIEDELYEQCKNTELTEENEGFDFHVMKAIANGTPLPKDNKCKWIYYDYRTVCPRKHDNNNPYWRIPENKMDALRYCPYCGKEIEIEADKESEE